MNNKGFQEKFIKSLKLAEGCPHSQEELAQAYRKAQHLLEKDAVMIRNAGGTPCRLATWEQHLMRMIETLAEDRDPFFFEYERALHGDGWAHDRPYVHNCTRLMHELHIPEPPELKEKRETLIREFASERNRFR